MFQPKFKLFDHRRWVASSLMPFGCHHAFGCGVSRVSKMVGFLLELQIPLTETSTPTPHHIQHSNDVWWCDSSPSHPTVTGEGNSLPTGGINGSFDGGVADGGRING
ncbi:hypothetical protein Nepgr_003702 [Nepenthes gracilis]|uniref:Uncharacterized protein n=1 Tax=Nepenthes gracilis TaxID=150966 RepID=A0AAD3S047_NEPGR|nr:hypothetical protein Nepgr_003702 [Nepenthes gracilis]